MLFDDRLKFCHSLRGCKFFILRSFCRKCRLFSALAYNFCVLRRHFDAFSHEFVLRPEFRRFCRHGSHLLDGVVGVPYCSGCGCVIFLRFCWFCLLRGVCVCVCVCVCSGIRFLRLLERFDVFDRRARPRRQRGGPSSSVPARDGRQRPAPLVLISPQAHAGVACVENGSS